MPACRAQGVELDAGLLDVGRSDEVKQVYRHMQRVPVIETGVSRRPLCGVRGRVFSRADVRSGLEGRSLGRASSRTRGP